MRMNRSRLAGGLIAVGTTGALMVPMTAPAQAVEIDLEAHMRPTGSFPHARGHAEYEAENGHREFEISIAGVRALHGRRVIVRVHGTFVGSMTVNQFGRAHLDRHTNVRVHAGNVVRVRTGSGRLVTWGTFHRDFDPDGD